MKTAIRAIAVSMMMAMPAYAQDRTLLPDVVVTAPPPRNVLEAPPAANATGESGTSPRASTHERCGDAAMDDARSFNCLNQRLKRQVDRVNPVQNTPPLDAKSPDLKIGVINVPGVQQQYGRNFGVSAFPFRPPPPVFTSPLGHR